jgi:hypothetical protein
VKHFKTIEPLPFQSEIEFHRVAPVEVPSAGFANWSEFASNYSLHETDSLL